MVSSPSSALPLPKMYSTNTYRSSEGLKPREGFAIGCGRRVSSLHGNHKDQQEQEQEEIEHEQSLEEQEVGEDAGPKATADLLEGIMPGLEGVTEGQKAVPEIPEPLQRKQPLIREALQLKRW